MLFDFEAMNASGVEIKDVIEAPTEEEAQANIRQMGYFVTMIQRKREKEDFLLTPMEEGSAFPRRNKSLVIPAIVAFIVGLLIGLLF